MQEYWNYEIVPKVKTPHPSSPTSSNSRMYGFITNTVTLHHHGPDSLTVLVKAVSVNEALNIYHVLVVLYKNSLPETTISASKTYYMIAPLCGIFRLQKIFCGTPAACNNTLKLVPSQWPGQEKLKFLFKSEKYQVNPFSLYTIVMKENEGKVALNPSQI